MRVRVRTCRFVDRLASGARIHETQKEVNFDSGAIEFPMWLSRWKRHLRRRRNSVAHLAFTIHYKCTSHVERFKHGNGRTESTHQATSSLPHIWFFSRWIRKKTEKKKQLSQRNVHTHSRCRAFALTISRPLGFSVSARLLQFCDDCPINEYTKIIWIIAAWLVRIVCIFSMSRRACSRLGASHPQCMRTQIRVGDGIRRCVRHDFVSLSRALDGWSKKHRRHCH